MLSKIKEAAKFVAAIIGAALTAGSTFIPTEWAPWLSFVLAIITAVAVYSVPNAEVAE